MAEKAGDAGREVMAIVSIDMTQVSPGVVRQKELNPLPKHTGTISCGCVCAAYLYLAFVLLVVIFNLIRCVCIL